MTMSTLPSPQDEMRQRAACMRFLHAPPRHVLAVYGEEEGDEHGVLSNQSHGEDASAVILQRLDETKQFLQSSPNHGSGEPARASARPAHHREPLPTLSAGLSPGHHAFDNNAEQADRRGTSRTPYPALRCESVLRWPLFNAVMPEEDTRIESLLHGIWHRYQR